MTDPLCADGAVLDDDAPFFDYMLEHWPGRDTARHVLNAVHRMDVERASQPPVIHVTVPGIPGLFTGTAGSGIVAYEPAGISPETAGGFFVPPEPVT